MTSLDELIWATGLPEPSDPAEAKAYQHLIATARAVLNGQEVWRCWDNIAYADWIPNLQRPHYCHPTNVHKNCGWVRIIDLEGGTE
jgi:hypothetical protein